MLTGVETFDLVGPGYAQPHSGVEHFEDHKCGHNGQRPGNCHSDDLGDKDRAAFQQTQRLAIGKRAGCPGGKYAGQQRTQRAANAVYAEDIERIVVTEVGISRRCRPDSTQCPRQRPLRLPTWG